MPIRSFSSELEDPTANRSIDNDAPEGLRQELIDAVYLIFERIGDNFDESRLHKIITQSLGMQPSGNPYGGFRYAVGRDIGKAPWQRVYDLIIRLRAEVPALFHEEYRIVVNRLLAAYKIAWDLGEDGKLHRVLPVAAQSQVEAVLQELSQPRFASALSSFHEAMVAYDDRPQRGRDACKNVFDALESVSKEVFGMPTATFGNVLAEVRKRQAMAAETIAVLQKMYEVANGHFRHGMTTTFTLKPAEVDFVLVSCVAGILLFVRL
jgi:hypothetical protein